MLYIYECMLNAEIVLGARFVIVVAPCYLCYGIQHEIEKWGELSKLCIEQSHNTLMCSAHGARNTHSLGSSRRKHWRLPFSCIALCAWFAFNIPTKQKPNELNGKTQKASKNLSYDRHSAGQRQKTSRQREEKKLTEWKGKKLVKNIFVQSHQCCLACQNGCQNKNRSRCEWWQRRLTVVDITIILLLSTLFTYMEHRNCSLAASLHRSVSRDF